jgi:uncharacterized repeat protein (TIGR01451 family)
MKYIINKTLLIALVAIFGVLLGSHSMAQTLADFDIDNTATVSFSAGGAALSIISSPTGNTTLVGTTPGAGLTPDGVVTTFKVDRLIAFTVAEQSSTWNFDGSATASSGETDVVLSYTVTNSSNAPLGFDLHAEGNGSGITLPGGGGFTVPGTGSAFTPTGITIAVDNPGSGTPGIYDAADTATTINSIAANGGSALVFVLVDVPTTANQDDYALVTLVAQSAETDAGYGSVGAIISRDDNGNRSPGDVAAIDDDIDDATVQDVFNDGVGDATYEFVGGGAIFGTPDIARNGQASDTDGVLINGANVRLTKTAEVIWDPINLASNPKAIPGAFVEYTLTIENIGGDTASLTTLIDTLATQLIADQGLLDPAGCDPTVLDAAPDSGCVTQNGGTDYTASTTEGTYAFTNNAGTGADATGFLADTEVFNVAGNVAITFNTGTGVLSTAVTSNTGSDGDLEAGQTLVIVFNTYIQ